MQDIHGKVERNRALQRRGEQKTGDLIIVFKHWRRSTEARGQWNRQLFYHQKQGKVAIESISREAVKIHVKRKDPRRKPSSFPSWWRSGTGSLSSAAITDPFNRRTGIRVNAPLRLDGFGCGWTSTHWKPPLMPLGAKKERKKVCVSRKTSRGHFFPRPSQILFHGENFILRSKRHVLILGGYFSFWGGKAAWYRPISSNLRS